MVIEMHEWKLNQNTSAKELYNLIIISLGDNKVQ